MYTKIKQIQNNSSDHIGGLLNRSDSTPEELTSRINRVLERQDGSAFRELKNVEVLKRIEDHVDESAKGAIEQAQHRAFDRFSTQTRSLNEGERSERFESYTKNIRGDQTRFLEIFDDLKTQLNTIDNLPPEIVEKIERAKDIAAKRFQTNIESFGDEAFREQKRHQAFARFQDSASASDVGRLRVMDDIRQRVQFEDKNMQEQMEKDHDASITKFIEAFPDAKSDAEKFRELSKKMSDNPDPKTMRLIQALEEKVKADPNKRAFIEQMEQMGRESKQAFMDRAQEDGDEFFRDISSTNPEDLEMFKQLQKEFSNNPEDFFRPEDRRGPEFFEDGQGFDPSFNKFDHIFDSALKQQASHVSKHLDDRRDPDFFPQFERDLPPELRAELEAYKNNPERPFGQGPNRPPDFEFGETHEESRRRQFDGQFEPGNGQPFPPEFRNGEFEGGPTPFDPFQGNNQLFPGPPEAEEMKKFFPPNFSDEPGQPFPPQQEPFIENNQQAPPQPINHGAFPPPQDGNFQNNHEGSESQYENFKFEEKFENDDSFKYEEKFESDEPNDFNQTHEDELQQFFNQPPPQQPGAFQQPPEDHSGTSFDNNFDNNDGGTQFNQPPPQQPGAFQQPLEDNSGTSFDNKFDNNDGGTQFNQPPPPEPSVPIENSFQPINADEPDGNIEKISLSISEFLSHAFPGLAPLAKAFAKSWNSF